MAFCAHCGSLLHEGAGFCATCGQKVLPPTGNGPSLVPPASQPAMRTDVHVHLSPAPADLGKPISSSTAIVALVLNIIVWPGLGSLVAGENVGWAQGFLTLFGVLLIFTIIGIILAIPLMIGMWIWGIVTGVQLIGRANAQEAARAQMRVA